MKRILLIRQRLNMSRRGFADALGVSVGAISNYENGCRYPKISIANRMLKLARQHGYRFNLDDIYLDQTVEGGD